MKASSRDLTFNRILAAFVDETLAPIKTPIEFPAIKDHTNSAGFVTTALAIFNWIAKGIISKVQA